MKQSANEPEAEPHRINIAEVLAPLTQNNFKILYL